MSAGPRRELPLVLYLAEARRSRDNRVLDTAIHLANSVGRSIVCYVELDGDAEPHWVHELRHGLQARSVGIHVGRADARHTAFEAMAVAAVLVEAGGDGVPVGTLGLSHLVEVPVVAHAFEAILVEDQSQIALWERAERAARALSPRDAVAPIAWRAHGPAVELAPIDRSQGSRDALQSTDDAEHELRSFCTGELVGFAHRGGDHVDVLAGAINAGMLAPERVVHSVVESHAPRADQEMAFGRLWPTALRSVA